RRTQGPYCSNGGTDNQSGITGVFTVTPIRDTPAPDAGLGVLPRELAACRQEGGGECSTLKSTSRRQSTHEHTWKRRCMGAKHAHRGPPPGQALSVIQCSQNGFTCTISISFRCVNRSA